MQHQLRMGFSWGIYVKRLQTSYSSQTCNIGVAYKFFCNTIKVSLTAPHTVPPWMLLQLALLSVKCVCICTVCACSSYLVLLGITVKIRFAVNWALDGITCYTDASLNWRKIKRSVCTFTNISCCLKFCYFSLCESFSLQHGREKHDGCGYNNKCTLQCHGSANSSCPVEFTQYRSVITIQRMYRQLAYIRNGSRFIASCSP